ncbi:hypothetical protein [Pseudomonas violetae]|jgi:hypothetical protein|uniref:Uncharacterized protein n=1 Tax=Pseudomonas violetae TaxID=2915813 RepID=A0ABT0F7Y3_9PSED|nr:hypothetical protein [Pseudomonas violetae]MCK1794115.1 hypothetical protein [Pseudomonas violetae]
MAVVRVGHSPTGMSDAAILYVRKHLPAINGVLPFPDFLQRALPSAGDPFDLDLSCQNRRTKIGAVSYK